MCSTVSSLSSINHDSNAYYKNLKSNEAFQLSFVKTSALKCVTLVKASHTKMQKNTNLNAALLKVYCGLRSINCQSQSISGFFSPLSDQSLSSYRKTITMNSNNRISINCFNCRGLRNDQKIQNIFSWLKTSRPRVTFLQETHSTLTDEKNGKENGEEIFTMHTVSSTQGQLLYWSLN